MLNHIVIMGRLVRDVELRRTGSGVAVASFTVAVDRDFSGKDGGEKETDFIDCVAWRQTGEFVSKYFSKGRMIVVSGRLQIRTWTDKDGNNRRTAEIVADNCYFGDSKKDGEAPAQGGNSYGGSQGGNTYGGNAPDYAPQNSYPGNRGGYGQQSGGTYGGYSQPNTAPSSDFTMLDDYDAHLPF